MADNVNEKLIRELRQQTSVLMAGAHLLDGFVEERGGEREKSSLASVYKGLYTLLRTLRHLELVQEEDPASFPEAMDLAQFCDKLCREVSSLTGPLEVSFRWDAGDPLPAVADRHFLSQAVLNLLTNAFEAAGRGGKVELRCSASGGRCQITVIDNGPSRPAPDLSDTPLLKQPGGVGLGLDAAQRAARLLGGTAVLQYGPTGTAAVLTFPLNREDSHPLSGPVPDWSGGLSDALVEFAPLLPAGSFGPRVIE